jgi:deazaflavin-dependent oxidoreductase (nitroreductase family)
MSETSQETGHQGSMGFRIVMKVVGTIHRALYRASDGKLGRTFFGSSVLLLTTTGRKTRRARTWPLSYISEEDQLIVLAANGGQPNHPAWYTNLRANPRASVQLGDRTRLMIAHTAQGDERARLWSQAVREYPAYERYQQKTTRQIPVVILRPAASVEGEDKADQGQPTP